MVALPIGLATADISRGDAPDRARRVLKPMIEVLAGIPTVVYGYFALTFVTPQLQRIFPDMIVFNALSAGVVMGVMIIPMVSSLSEDAMISVPRSLRQAAYALGATKLGDQPEVSSCRRRCRESWRRSYSPPPRAIGETMLVTIAAGATPRHHRQPARKHTDDDRLHSAARAQGEASHDSVEYKTIFAVGLLALLMTLSLNLLGHWVVRRWRQAY